MVWGGTRCHAQGSAPKWDRGKPEMLIEKPQEGEGSGKCTK